MARYDGSIRINTLLNTLGLRRGEQEIRGSMGRISNAARKMAAVIASAFAVGKIVQFGKEALEAASDFEAMEAQFSQVFGELESAASESLSRVAGQAGIMEERMKNSFTKIAAFAKTTGMDTASSLKMSERAMIAVADSAAFYDRSLEETTEYLQSFLKGNYENDAALGLSATEFTRNAAANKLYGKSFIELSEAQKQLTLLQMVEDANKLSGAMGQAAREADTWTNQTGNLSQAWMNLKANLGKIILPGAIQAVKAITNVINSINAMIERLSVAAGAFRSFSELLTGNKSKAGSGVPSGSSADMSSEYNSSAASAESLADATNAVADATNKAKKANDGYLSGLDEIRRYDEKDKSDSASGVGDIASGIGQDVDYGNLAEGDTIIDKLNEKAMWLKEVLAGLMKPFKDAWEAEGASTIEAARFAFESLGGLVKSVGKSFYEVWTNGTGTETLEYILQIAQNVLLTIGNIASKIDEAWNKNSVGTSIIQNIFNLLNIVLGTIERITGSTAEWASELDFYPLLESVNGLLESMQPLTQNIGDGLAWFYENVLLPIAGWTIEDAIPAFLDMLSAAIDALNEVIEALKPLGIWLWENFLQPLGQWAGDVIISAMETITGLLTKFSGWISENQSLVEGFVIVIGSFFAAWKVVSFASTIAGIIKSMALWVASIISYTTTVGLATAATSTFKLAMGFLTSPVTIAVAIIGSLIAIGVLLWKNWDTIKEKAIEIWGAIRDWFKETIDKIKEFFSGLWKGIKETFANVGGWFKEKFEGAFTGIKNAFSSVGDFFSGVWKGIKDVFGNIAGWFKDKFSAAWEAVKNVFSKGGKIFDGIKDGILNGLKAVINALIDGINSVITIPFNGINYALRSIKGVNIMGFTPFSWIQTIDVPQIPRLATGAVIPPNREFLAVLGDQKHGTNIEAPEGLIRKIVREEMQGMQSQQGGKAVYSFIAQINRRVVFNEVIEEGKLRQTIHGRNPFDLE